MSSFSDDEDMAGYSDDDYGMSSDGDQSYGEVEEVPAANKVWKENAGVESMFFLFLSSSRCFDVFFPSLPALVFAFSVAFSSLPRRRRPRQIDPACVCGVFRRKK